MSTTVMYRTLIYAPRICALISPGINRHVCPSMIAALCGTQVRSPVHKSNWQCLYNTYFDSERCVVEDKSGLFF